MVLKKANNLSAQVAGKFPEKRAVGKHSRQERCEEARCRRGLSTAAAQIFNGRVSAEAA
jgi:hypothetical protein